MIDTSRENASDMTNLLDEGMVAGMLISDVSAKERI
jgi:hypothetical protein